MFKSFDVAFNYSDFLKKLKHYFSDTAPIYAEVKIKFDCIVVSNDEIDLEIPFSTLAKTNDAKEVVNQIVEKCEIALYPKMVDITEQHIHIPEDRKREMLMQGYSIEQIRKKQLLTINKYFVITRFNFAKNSIDFRELPVGKTFRAFIHRPLLMVRDHILTLSKLSQVKQYELYRVITENSKVEELQNASIPTNTN